MIKNMADVKEFFFVQNKLFTQYCYYVHGYAIVSMMHLTLSEQFEGLEIIKLR
jgi:hypothetical protein